MADQPLSPADAPLPPDAPETPVDAGSQALSEALRSSFGIVKLVMLLLVVVFICSGIFKVEPQEQAMIIRLGRPVGEGEKALLGPGLHWSLPYPIDEHVKVPITSIQKVTSTVGWYQTTAIQEASGTEPELMYGTPLNPLIDGYVLTADNNIIHTRATLTYHIAEPVAYVFNFVNASNMVQSALDNALLYAASHFKVDDILIRDVAGFQDAVRKHVMEMVMRQKLGIVVEECQVRSRAPRQLKDAFDSVLNAELSRSKLLDQARSFATQTTNRASAEAQSRVSGAQSERDRLVKDLAGEAERFSDLLPRCNENPSLFAQQRLTETLGRVLTNVQDKIFLTEGNQELRLLLNRDFPKKAEEPKP